jgi:hypothetical protein
MRLYRGIAVPSASVSSVITNIRATGLRVGQGSQWSMASIDLKPRLQELRQANSLKFADTRIGQSVPRVCACGDEIGATYYASRHNRSGNNDGSILIEFDADVADVIVDARDFLYSLFQGGDPQKARDVIKGVFGEAVLHFLDRAWATRNQEERVAWCDLATQDNGVIVAHAANKMVLGGRYNTRFCSAFMVRLPVPASRITNVKHLQAPANLPEIEVSVYDLRAR